VLLIVDFFRRGLAAARVDILGAAIFGGVIAEAVQNLVDFNWHVPANAVTFAALAGLAVQAPAGARRHAQTEAAEPGTEGAVSLERDRTVGPPKAAARVAS